MICHTTSVHVNRKLRVIFALNLIQLCQVFLIIWNACVSTVLLRLVWNGGITKDQSNEIERIQKRALKIIYKEDDYDKCLQTAELVSLKERRDQMCIQLIKSMSNSDHKLHNVLPKKVHEIRNRETRQNSHMYYNFKWRTERFKNSPISYAISKYNEKFFV